MNFSTNGPTSYQPYLFDFSFVDWSSVQDHVINLVLASYSADLIISPSQTFVYMSSIVSSSTGQFNCIVYMFTFA